MYSDGFSAVEPVGKWKLPLVMTFANATFDTHTLMSGLVELIFTVTFDRACLKLNSTWAFASPA